MGVQYPDEPKAEKCNLKNSRLQAHNPCGWPWNEMAAVQSGPLTGPSSEKKKTLPVSTSYFTKPRMCMT